MLLFCINQFTIERGFLHDLIGQVDLQLFQLHFHLAFCHFVFEFLLFDILFQVGLGLLTFLHLDFLLSNRQFLLLYLLFLILNKQPLVALCKL